MDNIEMQNKIVCGNCASVLKDLADKSVDLIVTSPPYGSLRDYDGFTFDFQPIARELYRILVDGGVMVWIVADEIIDGEKSLVSSQQTFYFKEIGFRIHDWMIALRDTPVYPAHKKSVRYGQTYENMIILSKGKPKTVNIIIDKKASDYREKGKLSTYRQKDGTRIQKRVYNNKFVARTNVWNYGGGLYKSTNDKIAFQHPAVMSEDLARDHIYTWSNPNELVLDPFCGSGTTCKMAYLLNRKYIGIDMSQKYCELARKRIQLYHNKQYTAQEIRDIYFPNKAVTSIDKFL